MSRFSQVTLICADGTPNSKKAKELLFHVAGILNCGDAKFFSSGLDSLTKYNKFIVNELNQHINTDYCMIMQLDGHPINFNAWEHKFFEYDYIGAPWYNQPWALDQTVGNGGFSLRSKRFLEESSKLEFDGQHPEDVFLCRMRDAELKEKGIKFAPHDVAYRFSVEDMPYKGQFGFHGKGTIAINKHFGILK